MSFETELRDLIRARYALIQIASHEETRVLEVIAKILADLKHGMYVWSAAHGLTINDTHVAEQMCDIRSAIDACEAVARKREPAVFVFLDPSPHIGPEGNPIFRRRLKDFANRIKSQGYRANCILLSHSSEIAMDLQKDITLLDFPLPDRDMVRAAILAFAESHKGNTRLTFDLEGRTVERLVEAALGLTLAEIDNCLSKSLVSDLKIDAGDVATFLNEKQQTIRKSGILEFIDVSSFSLDNVGGLETLKRWLTLRSIAFSRPAKEFGVTPPKGVLLTGVPGCGKSLTAKCVAAAWRMPLLKLDMGRVFQGIVGSSEANMRQALATAEAVAPAILWVDEIEKGLAGVGGASLDSGTSQRVFGSFLTWMQEKKSPVFVFATANNINSLPPELLRKGRFDEIFFVDLPSPVEREAIISIQLKSLRRNPEQFDIPRLAQAAGEANLGDGIRLSGAEIEAWFKDAMLEAFRRRISEDKAADLSMTDLEVTLSRIVPMAKMRSADISALRAWARENAVSASLRDGGGRDGGAAADGGKSAPTLSLADGAKATTGEDPAGRVLDI